MEIISRQRLPRRGLIVVLNGASSAGKSSIARELQAQLPAAYLHVQLDAFRAMEPERYFVGGQPELSALRFAALCRALNATCAEYARHGQNVLLDHVLTRDAWTYLAEDFREFRVLLVGIRCSQAVLEKRERERGDRPLGLAASQARDIHAGLTYDCEVDTSEKASSECARELAEWVASGPGGGAFREVVSRSSTAGSS